MGSVGRYVAAEADDIGLGVAFQGSFLQWRGIQDVEQLRQSTDAEPDRADRVTPDINVTHGVRPGGDLRSSLSWTPSASLPRTIPAAHVATPIRRPVRGAFALTRQ